MKEITESLREGSVVAGRFTVLGLAGHGGMGTVYRTRDAATGQLVAVKVLRPDIAASITTRFMHEAQILSELRHPGIVEHVAHGLMSDGKPYLAMAWLEGEDLAARLSRVGLLASECLVLLRCVAEALAVAHRRGIIHRDLKPANLFLRSADPANVAILDFGIAHRPHQPYETDYSKLTQTGAVMGTPEYMAPEQARGDRGIGPSADVFSLGSILFECLTGQPPFSGEHFAAVLAKILFAEPLPLRQLRPDLPEEFDTFVRSMLNKNPGARPADAEALLVALRTLGPLPDTATRPQRRANRPPRKLTNAEQHFVCVLAAAVPLGPIDSDATLYPKSLTAEDKLQRERLEQSLFRLGAEVEWLPDATLICSMARISHIADQVRQAGRAALAIAKAWPQALVAVATGQGQQTGSSGLPLGEALDRVVQLLRQVGSTPDSAGRIILDALTPRFLDARFLTEPQPGGLFALLGVAEDGVLTPKVLGRPTPFVGREQELGGLLSIYHSCKDESVSRAVLVTAPAGAGKSRLLRELRRRLGDEGAAIHWLIGQADPVGGGASGGLLGQAIARFCGLGEAQDADSDRAAIRRIAAARVPAEDVAQVSAFLGELCGVPFPEEEHSALTAARLSPQIRNEQLSQAVLALLGALSRERPTLVVLEDLHWGDEQSVRFLDTALRELVEQPLLVLAFARPEVHDVFGKLWFERNVQELRLMPLSKRACELLLLDALGDQVDAATRARLIAQSSGNALFLEELIRAHKEGHTDEAPPTVLAMLQARLLRLSPELRRILRAASVFGVSCWRDGIVALTGSEDETSTVEAALQSLVREEILERRAKSRLSGQLEYGFRHALMQQAAYNLLPEKDRIHGHAQAAAFLAGSGVGDAAEIASHFERGAEKARALPYYLQAAQLSFDQLDLPPVLRYVDRAFACGADEQPVSLSQALALQCMAYRYQGDFARMVGVAERALALLTPGEGLWFKVLYSLSLPLRARGERGRVIALAELWASVKPQPGAEAAFVDAGAWFTVFLAQMAEHQAATLTWQHLDAVMAQQTCRPQYLSGLLSFARCEYLRVFAPDPFRQLSEVRAAVEWLVKSGGVRDAGAAQITLGQTQTECGDLAGGVRQLEACVQLAERLRQPYMVIIAKGHLMAALSRRAETVAAAIKLANELLQAPNAGDGFRSWAHVVLGRERLRNDDLAAADEALQKAIGLAGGSPLRRLLAASLRVHLLLRQGAVVAAHALSEELLTEARERGGGGYASTEIGLAAIAARWAAGDREGAAALQKATADEVTRRANLFQDEAARAGYLSQLSENVVALSDAPWQARFPL